MVRLMATRHDAQRCSSPHKRTYRKTVALETQDQPAVANLKAIPGVHNLVMAKRQQGFSVTVAHQLKCQVKCSEHASRNVLPTQP